MGEAKRKFDANDGKVSIKFRIAWSKRYHKFIVFDRRITHRTYIRRENMPEAIARAVDRDGQIFVMGFLDGKRGMRIDGMATEQKW